MQADPNVRIVRARTLTAEPRLNQRILSIIKHSRDPALISTRIPAGEIAHRHAVDIDPNRIPVVRIVRLGDQTSELAFYFNGLVSRSSTDLPKGVLIVSFAGDFHADVARRI
jgi:hypothetical protein